MAKKKALKKKARPAKPVKKAVKKKSAPAARRASAVDALIAPVKGATRRDFGHVQLEVGRAGAARVKRMIYPVGFHWAVDMKPVVGTELCMHAHVGFLARGHIAGEYADGCTFDYVAPQVVAIEPGHDAWVVGDDVTIGFEFDSSAADHFAVHD